MLGRSHETDWGRFVGDLADEVPSHLYAAAIHEMERHLLSLVLERTGGNQSQAARILGISRFSLRKKLAKLQLQSHPAARAPERG